jgi:hypothetical protein
MTPIENTCLEFIKAHNLTAEQTDAVFKTASFLLDAPVEKNAAFGDSWMDWLKLLALGTVGVGGAMALRPTLETGGHIAGDSLTFLGKQVGETVNGSVPSEKDFRDKDVMDAYARAINEINYRKKRNKDKLSESAKPSSRRLF